MKLNEWFDIECLKYKDDDGKTRTPYHGRIRKKNSETILGIYFYEPGQEEFAYEFTVKGVEEFIEKASRVLEDMKRI